MNVINITFISKQATNKFTFAGQWSIEDAVELANLFGIHWDSITMETIEHGVVMERVKVHANGLFLKHDKK